MNMYLNDRRIETLRNVADWNDAKKVIAKDQKDRDRHEMNSFNCREEILDIIRMEAAS